MGVGKLFVVSAPSGAGKTTLVKAVLEHCGQECHLSQVVTTTTRPPREGEISGVHYNFVSIDEFKKKIQEGAFLEWSTWYDHYYGSPKDILDKLKEGKSFILVVDRPGAAEIREEYKEAILIWIEPPSIEELGIRLKKRGKDSEAAIAIRLEKAAVEIEEEQSSPLYKYHVINDDFKVTVQELCTILAKEQEKV